METFGNFIFWMIKIFLLLIGFVLILGGGFCVVLPLFGKSDGYAGVLSAVGLVSVLIGWVMFGAVVRIIRKTSAAQDVRLQQDKPQTSEVVRADDLEGE